MQNQIEINTMKNSIKYKKTGGLHLSLISQFSTYLDTLGMIQSDTVQFITLVKELFILIFFILFGNEQYLQSHFQKNWDIVC